MALRNWNQETGGDNQQESCIEKYMFTVKVSASDGVTSEEVCVVIYSSDCRYWHFNFLACTGLEAFPTRQENFTSLLTIQHWHLAVVFAFQRPLWVQLNTAVYVVLPQLVQLVNLIKWAHL